MNNSVTISENTLPKYIYVTTTWKEVVKRSSFQMLIIRVQVFENS